MAEADAHTGRRQATDKARRHAFRRERHHQDARRPGGEHRFIVG